MVCTPQDLFGELNVTYALRSYINVFLNLRLLSDARVRILQASRQTSQLFKKELFYDNT